MFSLLSCSLLACQRAQEEPGSISIQLPTVEKLMSGVSSQAVISPSSLCFIVDIQGMDVMNTPGNVCEPTKGRFSGSKGPGEVLTIEGVTSGSYAFRVYALKKMGSTCPLVTKENPWGGYPLTKVYEVSPVITQVVSPENPNITIQIALPNETQTYAATHSIPTSCMPPIVAGTGTKGRVLSGGQFLLGPSMSKLYSKFNDKEVSQDLSNVSGRKIKNWKAGGL